MVIRFDKVSYDQFKKDYLELNKELSEEKLLSMYNRLKLPRRATKGSAAYDFFAPFTFDLHAGESIKIPTGIRAFMPSGVVLSIYPRSGQGVKYRSQLNNTVGVIDSDYYYSDNEGHIMLVITNDSKTDKVMSVDAGVGVAQGIFLQYLLTADDETTEERNGGFGSTGM